MLYNDKKPKIGKKNTLYVQRGIDRPTCQSSHVIVRQLI